MFDRVLVALDGTARSARAIAAANAVALATGASLAAFSVLTDADEDAWAERTVAIRKQLAAAGAARAAVEVRRRPQVSAAIAVIAGEQSGTLICMAPHADGGVGNELVGGNTEDLLHRVDGPVLLVGPGERSSDPTAGHLVMCTDGSAAAESVVPLGASWARRFDLVPTVIGLDAGRPDGGAFGGRSPRWRDIDVTFETLVDRCPVFRVAAEADAIGAGVIVVSTHAVDTHADLSVGRLAMGLVHQAPCPVLVQRPPTFASSRAPSQVGWSLAR